jgi:GDP-L-fucose synthase
VGTGEDETVRAIAERVRDVVHPSAELVFDPAKPDGMPRKLLDVSRIHALGWHHEIGLTDGLRTTYEWFCRSSARTSSIRGTEAISAAMRPAARA